MEFRESNILISGGAGFIGARLVEALLKAGARVIAIADSESNLWRIKPLLNNPGLSLARCPLSDTAALETQIREWGKVDSFVHLGLCVPQATNFSEQAMADITENLLPTLNLVKVLQNSTSGICFASSVAVYGNPKHLPVKEDDPLLPTSSYGATKLAIEHYLRAFGKTNQIPVTILRYSTTYGPGELGHRAIPNFIRLALQGHSPYIYGNGSEQKDYVYIDDVVEATIQAIVRKPSNVLNIGSNLGHSTSHIAQEVIRLCAADVEPVFLPQSGENTSLICDISSAADVLDFTPQTSLEEGLKREIEWFRQEAAGGLFALSMEGRT
jgi:UDP-glucose 4-epimerase